MKPGLNDGPDGVPLCIAFNGPKAIASGQLFEVIKEVKAFLEIDQNTPVLIFDYADSQLIEIDFRGSIAVIKERLLTDYPNSLDRLGDAKDDDLPVSKSRLQNSKDYLEGSGDHAEIIQNSNTRQSIAEFRDSESHSTRKPGRPKLGVVSREVTLLPRHWDWLNIQPGGASVALRKLVEEARKCSVEKDKLRIAQESTFRFMSAMAGDLPDFEESTRALFASNQNLFQTLIEKWPHDIKSHINFISASAFPMNVLHT